MNIIYICRTLEKHADEWMHDDDWWYGLMDCDINVHELDDGINQVDIYGVRSIWGADGEQYLETDTSILIDSFVIYTKNNEWEGEMYCSICNQRIYTENGHNAEPINSGRCCEMCNQTQVIPARAKQSIKIEKETS
tara:strand:+ start:258 stop:665 length:408 start_codon:yes stop_codon:yes gene_type:complete